MIRYDKKLDSEINRIIRNFNQKITRLEKEGRELLPDKVSKKELKKDVYSRKELNRRLKELQRFSKRGVEDIITTKTGIRLTKYELSNIKRESGRIKISLTYKIKKLESTKPKISGKVQSVTFAQTGDRMYLNLLARRKAFEKDILSLEREELERYKKLVKKSAKNNEYMNTIFKDNYFIMLTDLAYYVDYDNDKLDLLRKKLMTLKPNEFLKLFNDDKTINAIVNYYPIVTRRGQRSVTSINPDDIREDVTNLYDSLIENIDDIIKDYA